MANGNRAFAQILSAAFCRSGDEKKLAQSIVRRSSGVSSHQVDIKEKETA